MAQTQREYLGEKRRILEVLIGVYNYGQVHWVLVVSFSYNA